MRFNHIIVIVLFFLLTGCASQDLASNTEFEAQSHMATAQSKEAELNFQEAINEYTIIAEIYPFTPYYKTAVFRAALLNLHPENTPINYTAAQEWLQLYLKQPLSPKEKEIAILLSALTGQIIENLNRNTKLSALIIQQKDQARLKDVQRKETAERNNFQKIIEYEAELSKLRDKLQKMKEIDVQMHETRKNNSVESIESD